MIHPSDLRRRRRRCQKLVADAGALTRTPREGCNACGSARHAVLAQRDRYGHAVRTAMCLDCGLIYLLEPLSPAGYARFYSDGTYRRLTERFSGRRRGLDQVLAGQISYAERVLSVLTPHLTSHLDAKLLDIGASTGLVAERFRQRFGFQATLLDPASRELAEAGPGGVRHVASSFEEWQPDGRYDLVLLCRTLEHLADLRSSVVKIRELLTPGGLFYCDVADFFEICRLEGPPEVVSRLDHCFWLTQETALVFFRRFGFELVSMHAVPPYDQVLFVFRAGDAEPAACLPQGFVDASIRRLREIGSAWQESGRRALDPLDWLRLRAHRLKKLATS